MKRIKFLAVIVAAFALAAFALIGCSSSGSASSAASGSSSSASASASSASASSASESASASSESASASSESASASAASESASASAASASASSASSEDFTLVVGFDAEFPPYGYVGDDGSYTGVDLDLAKETCLRNGWAFKAEPIDWDAKDALLNADTINCIWNGFTIEGREGKYAFTEPYMHNAQVLVVKADSDVTTLADLKDKHVMTQADSAGLNVLTDEEGDYAEIAATFAGGAPETLGDYNNIFMQLESGAVDAVVCDLSVAARQIAAKPDAFKQVEELSPESFGVGFKLGNEALAATVTQTLKEMYADGTVEAIVKNYEDQAVSMDNWLLK